MPFAVLGASNCTFAEATRTQKLADFCASTVLAFEFFGCTPKIAVPDQLRSAVSGPDRYDPEINPISPSTEASAAPSASPFA